jgi:hypothetical protein
MKNFKKDSKFVAGTTLEDEIKEVEEKLEVHKQVIIIVYRTNDIVVI